MATHNSAVIVGYLTQNPTIQNEGRIGEEKVFLYLRTIRQGTGEPQEEDYQEVIAMYDEEGRMLESMKKLKRFDVILIKGVFNMVNAAKPHRCPACRTVNFKKQGAFPFIRPIVYYRLNNFEGSYECDPELPDRVLAARYRDFSNVLWILGTVCSKPQMIGNDANPVCRYKLGVDRKFYVRTQPDTKSDYPWVYSYGEQALKDYKTLEPGSVVFVSGYFHTDRVNVPASCSYCGNSYHYPDIVMSLVPYYVGYLDYKSEEQKRLEDNLMEEGLDEEEIREAVKRTKFGHNFQIPHRNGCMMTGYLTQNPEIYNEGIPGKEFVRMRICTARRDAEDVGKERFSVLDMFCDGPEELLEKAKELKEFDLILLSGVFRTMRLSSSLVCPNQECKATIPSVPYDFFCICPTAILKIDNLADSYDRNEEIPDEILTKHYCEIGNFMWTVGTVVSDPVITGTERHPICDYIITSSLDGSDNGSVPVKVESYGEHALSDFEHLEKGSGIFIDGFFSSEDVAHFIECNSCKEGFSYRTRSIRFIPYATEYLDYVTDEDIAMREANGFISRPAVPALQAGRCKPGSGQKSQKA